MWDMTSAGGGSQLKMDAASMYIPNYDPIDPRGVHSHFIDISAKAIGIADGIRGWEVGTGVEAGKFARMLMRNSRTAVFEAVQKRERTTLPVRASLPRSRSPIRSRTILLNSHANNIQKVKVQPNEVPVKACDSEIKIRGHLSITPVRGGGIDPKEILRKAYRKTKVVGSSTACLITVSGNILRAVNVGDSGFVIVRDGKISYRSPIQQYSFNNPYRLRKTSFGDNKTTLADEIEVKVESGDVIIAGTDGLFCNMHEAQLEIAVSECKKLGLSPKKIAYLIAILARRNSFDTTSETPFSKAARAVGYGHMGGKVADITVIVAIIQPKQDSGKQSHT